MPLLLDLSYDRSHQGCSVTVAYQKVSKTWTLTCQKLSGRTTGAPVHRIRKGAAPVQAGTAPSGHVTGPT
jgi:hypothetical protein